MGCRTMQLLMLVLLGSLLGCAPSGEPAVAVGAEEVLESPTLRGSNWPFQPTRLRIHPLTRIGSDTDETTGQVEYFIDLQVDLIDQFGHSTKGLGELRFELLSGGEAERSQRLEVWRIDITDLEVNTLHYDWVTRMYRFNLTLPSRHLAQHRRFRLQAFKLLPNGNRLQHEAVIEVEGE
ncbi:MAG: hypothetical protein ACF8NJ_05565 [Phycisphaerales bacterium JB038]